MVNENHHHHHQFISSTTVQDTMSIKFVWFSRFCYFIIFICTLLFCRQLFYLFLVVKNNAVQYRSYCTERQAGGHCGFRMNSFRHGDSY